MPLCGYVTHGSIALCNDKDRNLCSKTKEEMYICVINNRPYNELATYPGWTPASHNVSWDRLQPPSDPEKDKWFQIMDG